MENVFFAIDGTVLGHCGKLTVIDGLKARFCHTTRLHLTSPVARKFAAGESPFQHFNGARCNGEVWSMVWGDFEMFRNGSPSFHDFIATPGKLEGLPDPSIVATITAWLRARKITATSL